MTERERTGSAAAQGEVGTRSQTPYTVYILRCRGDRLYTGITTDLERRFSEHGRTVKSARFTRAFRPETVTAAWETNSRSAALKLEAQIKKLTRREKDRVVAENALDRFGDAFDANAYRRVR